MSAAASARAPVGRFIARLVGPVLLGLLLTLAVLSIGPVFGTVFWHVPDAHSSLPHRAGVSPLSAVDYAQRSLQPPLMSDDGASVSIEPPRLIGLLAIASTFHPPR